MKVRKGQTLIAIVAIMLIAVIIGATISSRFIARLKTFTAEDEASKAYGVAEAAIERMLLIPIDTLSGYITNNNCGSNCVLQITDNLGRTLRADVTLSFLGNSSGPFALQTRTEETSQIDLSGYPSGQVVTVCWNSESSIYASYVSENSGVVSTVIYAYNPTDSSGLTNGFSTASAFDIYSSCFPVTATNTPKLLRIKPYYFDTEVSVLPASGQILPKQGILITSKGTSGDYAKTVAVLKTYPIAPGVMDYVLLQKSPDEPLSNRSY